MQCINSNPFSIAVVLTLLTALVISGCKDSPVNPEPEPPETTEYTATLNLTPDGAVATDESGNTYSDGENLTQIEGTSLNLVVTATGYHPQTVTVTFDEDKTVTVTLDSEPPENVTLTFSIVNNDDEATEAELSLKASGEILSSGKSSGEVTLPFSESSLELCAEREFYAEACQSITPNADQALEFQIKQKTVTFAVTLDIRDVDEELLGPAGFTLTAGDVSQSDTLEYYGQDLEGPFKISLPMSEKTVRIEGESIYRLCEDYITQPYTIRCVDEIGNSLSRLNRALGSQSFVPNRDREITLELEKLIACQDGIDNDGDGNRDRGDTGCVTDDGVTYDPNDDVERLDGQTRIYISSSDQAIFVSSAEGHRQVDGGSDELPSSISAAVRIGLGVDAQVEASQDGEAFAFHFEIGPNYGNVFVSDIIEDDGRDGWVFFREDIPNNLFHDSQKYKIFMVHATKVRGNPPGDGNDDIFLSRGNEESRSFLITWTYEPEEVQNAKAKAAFQRDEQSGVITRHFENVKSHEMLLKRFE